MLKYVSTLGLLGSKFFLLLCFSSMGVLMMSPPAQAQMPCHDNLNFETSTLSDRFDNCTACQLALNAWSENFVATKNNFLNALALIVTITPHWAWENSLQIHFVVTRYVPPPQVVLDSAVPRAIPSTVIIV